VDRAAFCTVAWLAGRRSDCVQAALTAISTKAAMTREHFLDISFLLGGVPGQLQVRGLSKDE
jgi:hypothetical protein